MIQWKKCFGFVGLKNLNKEAQAGRLRKWAFEYQIEEREVEK